MADQITSAEPINTRMDYWTKLHSKSVYFKVRQCFLHIKLCSNAFIRLLSDYLRCTGTIGSHINTFFYEARTGIDRPCPRVTHFHPLCEQPEATDLL